CLLTAGADPNLANAAGETPLAVAIKNPHCNHDILAKLIQHGARLDVLNQKGETLLLHAVNSNNLEAVKFLVEYYRANQPTILSSFLNAVDNEQNTALHKAIRLGYFQIAHYLITQGVSVQAKNQQGETALSYAAFAGHLETVQLLLKQDGLVNAADNTGKTAFHQALYRNHFEICDYLLEYKANIEAITHEGFTIVHLLTMKNPDPNSDSKPYEIIEQLSYALNHGANVNSLCKAGLPPLYYALSKMQTSHDSTVVEWLLKRGAQINTVLEHIMKTPNSFMMAERLFDVMLKLKKEGMEFHIAETFFYQAVKNGRAPLKKAYLEAFNINLK